MKKANERSLDGYVLMESMVAAALLGFAISANVAVLAQARADVTRGSNRLVAMHHAHSMLDEQLAQRITGASDTTTANSPKQGMSTRVIIAQSNLHNASTPPLPNADELHLVTVEVTYSWSEAGTKTYQVSSLKRSRESDIGIDGAGNGDNDTDDSSSS